MTTSSLRHLPLLSPVIASSGVVAVGSLVARFTREDGIGALVTPGYGPGGRRGHPPRLRESAAGALYRPGTSWIGIREAVRRQGRIWETSPVPIIVNSLGEQPDHFAACAAQLEGVRGPVAIELNLAHTGDDVPLGHDPKLVARTVAGVRQACDLPVIVKLPFDVPDVQAVVAACAAARAAAVTLTGGVPVGDAYLVGPATFPLVLDLIRRVARAAPLPIIACGGVTGAREVQAYLTAGAAAVQVGSAHLANPRAAVACTRR